MDSPWVGWLVSVSVSLMSIAISVIVYIVNAKKNHKKHITNLLNKINVENLNMKDLFAYWKVNMSISPIVKHVTDKNQFVISLLYRKRKRKNISKYIYEIDYEIGQLIAKRKTSEINVQSVINIINSLSVLAYSSKVSFKKFSIMMEDKISTLK